MTGGPLSGMSILDLSQFLAGPFCGQVLGDLGARIIKVEPPGGEMTRAIPPYFVEGDSAYFLSVNRNKESIVLDLKSDAGRNLFLRLLPHVDAILESNRPGVLDELGIGFDRIHAVNPRAVLVSITGFGQDGPYRDRPAYDAIVQALSGVMSITGEKGGRPVRCGVPIGDLAAGMFAAIGCLSCLLESKASSTGRHVEVSMLDSQIAMLSYLGVYYLVSDTVPGPQGRGHISIPTYRAFTCADGLDVMVTANTERMWRGLCEAIGRDDLADEPRFETNQMRFANRIELWEVLEKAFQAKTSTQWVELLLSHDVPVAPINTIDLALADAQVQHRRMVLKMDEGELPTLKLLGNPVKILGNERTSNLRPPRLGEDTARILTELLGVQSEELADLAMQGAVQVGNAGY